MKSKRGGWPLCGSWGGGGGQKVLKPCVGKEGIEDMSRCQIILVSPKIRSTFQPLKGGNHGGLWRKMIPRKKLPYFAVASSVRVPDDFWKKQRFGKKSGKMTAVWKKSCNSWDRQNILSITKNCIIEI